MDERTEVTLAGAAAADPAQEGSTPGVSAADALDATEVYADPETGAGTAGRQETEVCRTADAVEQRSDSIQADAAEETDGSRGPETAGAEPVEAEPPEEPVEPDSTAWQSEGDAGVLPAGEAAVSESPEIPAAEKTAEAEDGTVDPVSVDPPGTEPDDAQDDPEWLEEPIEEPVGPDSPVPEPGGNTRAPSAAAIDCGASPAASEGRTGGKTLPPLSAEEKHRRRVEEVTELARNPARYEVYEAQKSEADPRLQVFLASCRGEGHRLKGMPCQDYCLSASGPGYTVIADADGVSACAHSDRGARLACKAVAETVQAVAEDCSSEEQLVERLRTVNFREVLVRRWMSLVMEEIGRYETEPEDPIAELGTYGSTLLFDIITPHWHVVGNLGDGQVLLFNDFFGVKLRMHAPKESSRVRCLSNPGCAREDFLTAAYPRSLFNGVLLSTDGMYESFDRGNHFYLYAMQLRRRFCSLSRPEPLQPFCYQEEGEPMKDFSVFRTMDDCSIALAVDTAPVGSHMGFMGMLYRSVKRHADAVANWRYGAARLACQMRVQDRLAEVVVAPPPGGIPDSLETAVMERPDEIWEEKGCWFSIYPMGEGETLEALYSNGKLRRHRAGSPSDEQRILRLYVQLSALQRELVSVGCTLNEAALFLLFFDGRKLSVRRECISPLKEDAGGGLPKPLAMLFSSLLGQLAAQGKRRPVLGTGYLKYGMRMERFDGIDSGALYQLVQNGRKYLIRNAGEVPWQLEDGTDVQPGQEVPLKDGLTFTVLAGKPVSYRYTAKERL